MKLSPEERKERKRESNKRYLQNRTEEQSEERKVKRNEYNKRYRQNMTEEQKEKINYLSKQLNAVAGIALVAVSMSDEGLLSKGMILTSLLSSHEPDENLDTLFEDLC